MFMLFLYTFALFWCSLSVVKDQNSAQNWHLAKNDLQAGNMDSMVEYPCGICKEEVCDSHAAVQCDSCMQWYHAHCHNISPSQYAAYVSFERFSWLCLNCGFSNFSSRHSESLSSLSVSNQFNAQDTSDTQSASIYQKDTVLDTSPAASPTK